MNNSVQRPRKLIIVSNRLPFNVSVENGELRFRESTGGLVTGISSYLESLSNTLDAPISDYLWVGWPGGTVDDAHKHILTDRAHAEFHSHPVFLTEHEMEQFYHGFCNKAIWPLFHYFPSYVSYSKEQWSMYRHVNERFADAVAEVASPNDLIWVHDYHLMLLPGDIQSRMPGARIGFFLHIPFPSFEIFRLLPAEWREGILDGMLGADLIGFHSHEYTRHFLQSVLRLLGLEHRLGFITKAGRTVRADTFPMGIDFQKFSAAMQDQEVKMERVELYRSVAGLKVILSVDRLDYSKGISNRLEGYQLLLEQFPEFRGKVVLIMVVVPSRIGVDQYDMLKRQIEELVGRINGKFGSVEWTPVIYQYRQLSFIPLTALYSVSDVALVTPLRDGMNLVSKEYIATRSDEKGVIILSEMAGAAKELGEAIIINPNDTQRIATALKDALEMPEEDQITRNQAMRERLKRYDVIRWANDFTSQLAAEPEPTSFMATVLRNADKAQLLQDYLQAGNRLLFLDYDGTLSPLMPHPKMAFPRKNTLALLQRLAADPKNTVVLVSGRDKQLLDRWFGQIPLNIVAEHGAWVRRGRNPWALMRDQTNGWKANLMPMLQHYADRLPGAVVEEKDYSIAWHYRMADPEQAPILERELIDHLSGFTANIEVQLLRGSKVVEIRNAGNTKGAAASIWIANVKPDFILAIGDDSTDEELFAVLPETAYSVRVGITNTRARFSVGQQSDVIQLLNQLASAETTR